MTELELRPYQRQMIDHAIKHDRCAWFAGMGMGKTSAALMLVDMLMTVGDIRKTLVLAPLRVAQSVWPAEAVKWSRFQHLRVQPILGLARERQNALSLTADIFTINYENLVWLINELAGEWPFDLVIADESTRVKSFRLRQGGVRAQALSKVAYKTKRWLNLTGTPAPNGLEDLWGQTWFLDRGERLGRTFTAFSNRWYRSRPGSNPTYQVLEPLPHAQAEIQQRLSDICLSVDPRDWFDLKEPIVNTVYVDLPPRARRHYKEMERDLFVWLTDVAQSIEAFGAASKSLKCLQIASGALYLDEDNKRWEVLHDEKIEALRSIVEEAAGAPVLVAYHFKSDLARLQKAFPDAAVLGTNNHTIELWNQGKLRILLAHPASAGHGLNLQDGGNIIVFFSHWWALEERAQIMERIGPVRQMQSGHNRNVFVHNIVARGTIDELVLERIETKREVQDILLDAMKRKAHG